MGVKERDVRLTSCHWNILAVSLFPSSSSCVCVMSNDVNTCNNNHSNNNGIS